MTTTRIYIKKNSNKIIYEYFPRQIRSTAGDKGTTSPNQHTDNKRSITSLSNNKAAGPDSFTAKCYESLKDILTRELTVIYDLICPYWL